MDYVSTKRTFLILGITFFVSVSIPASVYLFKKGYFDIRNLAGEEDSTDTESTDFAETMEGGVVLEENLAAQWNFNEESGIILYDMTISGNDGTLNDFADTDEQDESVTSGWTLDNAKWDGALMFDGEDDYISVADSTSLKPQEISISVWFNTEKDGYLVSKYQNVEPFPGYAMIIDSDVLSCWVGGDEWVSGEIEVTDGEWHYGVCTYDEENVEIYVDGELDVSEEQDSDMSYPASLTIGAFNLGSDEFFEGVIDCVQIFNVVLTLDDIQSKFEADDFEYTAVDTTQSDSDDSSSETTGEETESEELLADINQDETVDLDDYDLFMSDYDDYVDGGTLRSRSDLDSDDDIDMDDYDLFITEYTGG